MSLKIEREELDSDGFLSLPEAAGELCYSKKNPTAHTASHTQYVSSTQAPNHIPPQAGNEDT